MELARCREIRRCLATNHLPYSAEISVSITTSLCLSSWRIQYIGWVVSPHLAFAQPCRSKDDRSACPWRGEAFLEKHQQRLARQIRTDLVWIVVRANRFLGGNNLSRGGETTVSEANTCLSWITWIQFFRRLLSKKTYLHMCTCVGPIFMCTCVGPFVCSRYWIIRIWNGRANCQEWADPTLALSYAMEMN